MKQALDYAEALGCKLVHCMAGIVPAGVSQVTAGERVCRESGLGGGAGDARRA